MNPAIEPAGTEHMPVLLCLSHLRWNFVYQRPQHLMSRFGRGYLVLYLEEPLFDATTKSYIEARKEPGNVRVLIPHLPPGLPASEAEAIQRALLDDYLRDTPSARRVLWYYTPMMFAISEHLAADFVVYDCMDELSAFRGAPPQLVEREQKLLARADAVFTGGYSLFEAKRGLHDNVHVFPSSVDISHFAKARAQQPEPADQGPIPRPRIGFHGVIDERFDITLLEQMADLEPQWHFIVLGPVVKIDAESLPRRDNIHYLGSKDYSDLPSYLAGWDVAMMPFARNESTRFISPTKTPEYLAGGRAVVSTSITDVVRSYGDCGMVSIADSAGDFVKAISLELNRAPERAALCDRADTILKGMAWEDTWSQMADIVKAGRPRQKPPALGAASTSALQSRPEISDQSFDYLIVGAGFAGSVLAERLATQLGKRVLVIDRRPHVGGNAYDHYNEAGILIHKYGPHIFHTNSQRVVDYLSQFTAWRPYEHKVLADVDGQLVPMPINLTTLGKLYGVDLTPEEAEGFLKDRAEDIDPIKTSEDMVLSTVGRDLYEKFFKGYTRKQWGLDPSQLDKSVAARVPARTSLDDRYFTDTFQCMPLHGYTRMFEKMLDHANITVMTNTSYEQVRDTVQVGHTIYCGPVDEYFEYRFGRLPYRSLQFKHETLDQEQFQPAPVVNYPSEDVPYTRITEYKYLTGQIHEKTSVTYEIPSAEGDPYYPVPRPENAELYRRYEALADATPDVTFVGRLGTYRYYNMDQVVAQALSVFHRIENAEQDERRLSDAASYATS